MSYAPVLAAVFVLWPIMGLLGGQGYALLLALAALPALALARPKWPPALYAVPAILFVIWVIVGETWSPNSGQLVSGSLLEGNFAVKATSLRIFFTAAFTFLAVGGAMRIADGSAQVSSRVMLGAFAAQGLILAVSVIFSGPLLAAVYGADPVAQTPGIQNFGRNANAFALILPILIAYLSARPQFFWKPVVALLVVASLLFFTRVDTQSAMIGLVFMMVAMGLVQALPKLGFRILFTCIGAYIASAPMLIGTILRLLEAYNIHLPGSFQSRAWAWHVVIEKVAERPFVGHGIAASKTWRETYSDHPDWLAHLPDSWADYAVIPGHPHNMALQIWAETGMIGAVLVGFSLVLLGFRLPEPAKMREDIRFAIAGVTGVAFSLFNFAYNMWNEAFWSSVALAAIAIILLAKRRRESL
ncbi:O-antigen ligase family protein [Hyphomonas sp.]|uniref:O-antigen ligase family protein n=1 Tax=Hyphomonas sp. TaxID=87 RepID=UPI00352833E0